jgi:hypothetical protein
MVAARNLLAGAVNAARSKARGGLRKMAETASELQDKLADARSQLRQVGRGHQCRLGACVCLGAWAVPVGLGGVPVDL